MQYAGKAGKMGLTQRKEELAMRPDGTRVKEASTIVSALPYVMPRRYDAQNFITEYADMEVPVSYTHLTLPTNSLV